MKRTVRKEQYFTSPALAARCVEYAKELLDFSRFDYIVEPSAGAGAFFELLPTDRRMGIDLEPLGDSIVQADFLLWEPPLCNGPILTIGNPPFGQRAALAVAFLQHACRFSDAVAFILPRSFNKYTFQNRLHPNFHLVGSFLCEEFRTVEGGEVTINTVFQVWERRSCEREQVSLRSVHPDFEMRHCHLSRTSSETFEHVCDEYEFSIPQVGSNFSPRHPAELTKGSHWFVSPNVPGVRERFERLDFGFLDDMNTAHKSLSKKDIILAYELVVAEE